MADYTPEQVEALAEFARITLTPSASWSGVFKAALRLGLINPDGTLADWLRPEDWADRAARECVEDLETRKGFRDVLDQIDDDTWEDLRRALAAIIRKHAPGVRVTREVSKPVAFEEDRS